MSVISAIISLLEAIPTLAAWFNDLALAWAAHELSVHDEAFAKAHLALIKEHDQTLLEQAIGSQNAGQSSADPTDIIDRPLGGGSS